MNRINQTFLQRMVSGVGMAAIASVVALPSLAQTPEMETLPNRDRSDMLGPSVDNPNNDRPDTIRPEADNVPNSDRTNPDRVSPTAANRDALTSLDEEFVTLAYQGNNAEIQLSQLALERAENDEVQQFAEQMIRQHTQANELLTQYLEEQDIALPAEPIDSLNQAIAEQLSQLSGPQFDQAYMRAQENAHLRSIALYRTQLDQGQEEGLRAYAARLLPGIENHYQIANEISPNRTAEDFRPEMSTPDRIQ
ncbi:DUF4142 domain-containing protein [Leptolyngbya sp. AN02str]|uniref:DUF4142 domain-containing protein n=1 Tax=Leptolyngbya sp. AN02str TaxID=3423363 RepID=UPI003D318273